MIASEAHENTVPHIKGVHLHSALSSGTKSKESYSQTCHGDLSFDNVPKVYNIFYYSDPGPWPQGQVLALLGSLFLLSPKKHHASLRAFYVFSWQTFAKRMKISIIVTNGVFTVWLLV